MNLSELNNTQKNNLILYLSVGYNEYSKIGNSVLFKKFEDEKIIIIDYGIEREYSASDVINGYKNIIKTRTNEELIDILNQKILHKISEIEEANSQLVYNAEHKYRTNNKKNKFRINIDKKIKFYTKLINQQKKSIEWINVKK
jgi:hypothetical protein